MSQYKTPLTDIQFNLHTWLKITTHYQTLDATTSVDQSLVNAIIEESGKFAEEVLSPINHSGDLEGCQFNNGQVTTPAGFVEAYQQFCEAGWSSLASKTEFGGQGLPYSLSVIATEINSSANASWNMYPGLTHGAINALEHHATPELQAQYLPSLISGKWTGTMCLTESHCGSDLGLLKTKAIPNEDGSYHITGTKIFISAGEHNMSENIIHLVLARLPDAPKGTAGISLFLVPKILKTLNDKAQPTDNQVSCSAIEKKMGIKASATCVINFDKSRGYLIGQANKGLSCMFTMMNTARLATGIQGYSIAERAYQIALNYAKERTQMRSLSGTKQPEKEADPIIIHPDVKRMLLTQKSLIEGSRGLAYYTATLVDKVESNQEKYQKLEPQLNLLTPICKAFMSDIGFECTNHAVQILGGHGYINESLVEQLVRDVRISSIYEGTNGIQALDFLGRKILRDGGKALNEWIQQIKSFSETVSSTYQPEAQKLLALCDEWLNLTQEIMQNAQKNPDEIGAAASDFLMYSAYISVAYILLQQVSCVEQSEQAESFKVSKKQTMQFYFSRILTRTLTHQANILSANETLQCVEFEID